MKKSPITAFIISIFFATVCLFVGCAGDDDDDDSGAPVSDDDDTTDDDTSDPDDDDFDSIAPYCEIDDQHVEALLASMTLRDKIAQMYVVGAQVFPWFDIGKAERYIKEVGVGGVFFQPFTGIGLYPAWTVENASKVQNWALERENAIPLIIACDQEGGIPQALNHLTGGTDTPGNMGLGATFDPQATYDSYSIMGREISSVGISNAYAPVAGLMIDPEESSMYTRCFGEDTDDVSNHVRAAVLGFQDHLVIAGAKHFPSHSTAPGDEHPGLTVNSEPEADVRAKYFPPFVAAIEAGLDMMMITHSNYTAWEPEGLPTTFSKKLVTDVLRDELGYQGLIVTDDMNMGSITATVWGEHPDVLAIDAGIDLILDCAGDDAPIFVTDTSDEAWTYDLNEQIDIVFEAVQSGRLTEERINESVRRILSTKMKYCLFEKPKRDPDVAQMRVGKEDTEAEAAVLHEKALTLVRDDEGLIPVDPETVGKVHVVSIAPFQTKMYPDAFWGNLSGTSVYMEVQKILPSTTGSHFDVAPGANAVNRIVEKAEQANPDLLIIATYHAYYHTEQQLLVNALLELDIPTIVVAVALPYDLLAMPDVGTYFATYSNRNLALTTVAKAIFGLAEHKGRLPVSLPGMYEYGHGMVD